MRGSKSDEINIVVISFLLLLLSPKISIFTILFYRNRWITGFGNGK